MAAMAGMNTAITNPLHQPVRSALLASDLLLGRDTFGAGWIAEHRAKAGGSGDPESEAEPSGGPPAGRRGR
jgi:hypothetical protein